MIDLPLFAPVPPAIELPADALHSVERTILESKGVLSAESVEDRLTFAVREVLAAKPNAIGQVFMRLSRAGKIEHAGWTVAQRDKARGRALRLWRVRL